MPTPETTASRAGRGFTVVFLFCLGVVGAALWLQHWRNLDPCPWCVAQRIEFLAIALVALVGALHRPRGFGVTVYSTLIALLAAGGVAMASYQLWLQGDAERAMSCVGSPVEKILDAMKLGRLVPSVFMYDGPCTLKPWALFGMSIPAWSLVGFAVLLVGTIVLARFARR